MDRIDRRWLVVGLASVVAGCAAEATVPTYEAPGADRGPGAPWPAGSFEDAPPPAAVPVPPALTGEVEWARGFAGLGDNAGRALSVGPEGQVALAGYFWPSVDFGGGSLNATGYDTVVARYEAADGAFVAAHRVGGAGNHFGAAVRAGANGVVAVGGAFSGELALADGPTRARGERDGFVVVRDAAGRDLFARTFGGAGGRAEVTAVAGARDGSLYVAGRFRGDIAVGDHELSSAGDWDGFAARLGRDGAVLWVDALATTGADAITGLVLQAAQGPSGAPVDVPVLAGYKSDAANATGVVRSLDRSGALRWGEELDGAVTAVASVGGNRVVVAGQRSSGFVGAGGAGVMGARAFVASYADGERQWVTDIQSAGDAAVSGIAVAPDGGVLATGHFEREAVIGARSLMSAGGSDIFVARFESSGAAAWAHAFGWVGDDAGLAVAARADGGAVVTGQYSGRVALGDHLLPHSSQRDIFLLGLAP